MKKYFITAIACTLLSCSGPKVDFTIGNDTGLQLDFVIVTNGIDKVKAGNILPDKESSLTLEFSDEVKTDGGYEITIYSDNTKRI